MNNTDQTAGARAVGDAVARVLRDTGELPDGTFVDGYVVIANVWSVNGSEETISVLSEGLRRTTHRALLEEARDELRDQG